MQTNRLAVLALLIATASVSAQTARPAEPLPAEVQALRAQSAKLYEQGKYDQAIPLAQQYREQVGLIRGKDDLDYAVSLGDLGMLYRDKGDFAAAESLLKRAAEIVKKALGEE